MPIDAATRQKRALAMTEEDEDWSPALRHKRTPSASKSAPAIASPTSPSPSTKLKLICGGKVYRPLSETSPPKARKLYDASTGLLGEPDEAAVVTSTEKRKRRRLITPEPGDFEVEVEAPTPPKRLFGPPTPPSSKRAKSPLPPSVPFDLQTVLADTADGFDPLTVALPEDYYTLLALHTALENGLVLHLATEGGRAANKIATTSTAADGTLLARLSNIITFRTLRTLVERGSNKRFGPTELARLKWLWDLVAPLGYTVTKMRELDPSGNGKRINAWGLGVEMVVQHHAPMPSMSLVGVTPPSPKGTPTKTGSRDSMSVVALWSQASEARIIEVRRRLGAFTIWQLRARGETPPTSAKRIKQRPAAFATSTLPQSQLKTPFAVPATELPDLMSKSERDSSLAPPSASASNAGSSPSTTPTKRSGTLDTRASSQLERIKARQTAKLAGRKSVQLPSEDGGQEGEVIKVETPAERMGELRERSALSRLTVIADAVYMLFSPPPGTQAPPSPSTSNPNPPTRKRRSVPLDEVIALVAKSSRLALSDGEARDAIHLLERVCPGFAAIREVDRRPWLTSMGEMSLRQAKEEIKLALARSNS